MKRSVFVCSLLIFNALFFFSCKKEVTNAIKFKQGTFPDSAMNLGNINSPYDDYNLDLYRFSGNSSIVFSSNRESHGGQFNIVQGGIDFTFDKTDGSFSFNSSVTTDELITRLLNKANTLGNDFGPYRFFSSKDGYEYMVLSSENSSGNLDLFFLRNHPKSGASLPEIEGPHPINSFNSSSDDAYFCFDQDQDTAYFASDRNGDFDIFMKGKPAESEIKHWFIQGFSESVKVDSINTAWDDKCPMIFKKIMVFASNRPGGFGGYDIYYSLLRKGKWSSPINLGPGINTASDEYRPVIGHHPDFTNYFLMFSSNRAGGKGGFDLYFSGVEFK